MRGFTVAHPPEFSRPGEVVEGHGSEHSLGAVGQRTRGAVEGEPRGELTEQRPQRHLLTAQFPRQLEQVQVTEGGEHRLQQARQFDLRARKES